MAEKVAARLDYRCLSREVILEASQNYHILIYTGADDRLSHKLEEKAKSLCRDIAGINSLEVHTGAMVPPQHDLEG